MMFTYDQGLELISTDDTTSEWITLNGVNGRKFINKTDSSKYIFISAGGYWSGAELHIAGEYGEYWSSTWIDSDRPQARCLYVNSRESYIYGNYGVYYGHPIRPIAPPRPW